MGGYGTAVQQRRLLAVCGVTHERAPKATDGLKGTTDSQTRLWAAHISTTPPPSPPSRPLLLLAS